jgi:hypothetical protein
VRHILVHRAITELSFHREHLLLALHEDHVRSMTTMKHALHVIQTIR